jgi:ribonuclease HI
MEVYVDSSVHPPSGVAVGCVDVYEDGKLMVSIEFELKDVSSTVAEFESFVRAIQHIHSNFLSKLNYGHVVTIYSDCEGLVKLLAGERKNDWAQHRHAALYQSAVDAHVSLTGKCPVVWIKGHDKKSANAASVHKTRFAAVDKRARNLLRQKVRS